MLRWHASYSEVKTWSKPVWNFIILNYSKCYVVMQRLSLQNLNISVTYFPLVATEIWPNQTNLVINSSLLNKHITYYHLGIFFCIHFQKCLRHILAVFFTNGYRKKYPNDNTCYVSSKDSPWWVGSFGWVKSPSPPIENNYKRVKMFLDMWLDASNYFSIKYGCKEPLRCYASYSEVKTWSKPVWTVIMFRF